MRDNQTSATPPLLREDDIIKVLVAAGWSPATFGGRRCSIDDWSDAGDFSTQAQQPRGDGVCDWVLLVSRSSADPVPALGEMTAALRAAGYRTTDSAEGMEFAEIRAARCPSSNRP